MSDLRPPRTIILTSDLAVASRLTSICQAQGDNGRFVTSWEACRELVRELGPSWVVIDLEAVPITAEEVAAIRRERSGVLRVVAFAPHVHEAKLDEARKAGCDIVWTRGQIHRDLATLLKEEDG